MLMLIRRGLDLFEFRNSLHPSKSLLHVVNQALFLRSWVPDPYLDDELDLRVEDLVIVFGTHLVRSQPVDPIIFLEVWLYTYRDQNVFEAVQGEEITQLLIVPHHSVSEGLETLGTFIESHGVLHRTLFKGVLGCVQMKS